MSAVTITVLRFRYFLIRVADGLGLLYSKSVMFFINWFKYYINKLPAFKKLNVESMWANRDQHHTSDFRKGRMKIESYCA